MTPSPTLHVRNASNAVFYGVEREGPFAGTNTVFVKGTVERQLLLKAFTESKASAVYFGAGRQTQVNWTPMNDVLLDTGLTITHLTVEVSYPRYAIDFHFRRLEEMMALAAVKAQHLCLFVTGTAEEATKIDFDKGLFPRQVLMYAKVEDVMPNGEVVCRFLPAPGCPPVEPNVFDGYPEDVVVWEKLC